MIEKVKRTINLGKKECLVCGKEFQPASGAQRTCSPVCKERAKAQGLTKRGPRKRGGVDPALLEPQPESALDRVQETYETADQPRQEASPRAAAQPLEASPAMATLREVPGNGVARSQHAPEPAPTMQDADELPDIEVDLEPLAKWVRAVVHQALAKEVKSMVDEAIRERLRALLGK